MNGSAGKQGTGYRAFHGYTSYAIRFMFLIGLLGIVNGLSEMRALGNPGAFDSEMVEPTILPQITIVPMLETASSFGANSYIISRDQIETISQGSNASFNQVLLRAPGVSQDSAGKVHIREEDPYAQYYINGILLPRGISGFGQDIDTRLVQSVSLEVGALPAEYGWGNYGIVSIRTQTGSSLKGTEISMEGGSAGTYHPSLSLGGSTGKTDFYADVGFLRDMNGIENPTPSARTIHDETKQYSAFTYLSHELAHVGELSFIGSLSHSDFQIPNNPNQTSTIEFEKRAATFPETNSSNLNENQFEQSYFGVVSFTKKTAGFSLRVADAIRYSAVRFQPDLNGDLYFNGVASRIFRDIATNEIQADGAFDLSASNTVALGILQNASVARDHEQISVFAAEDDDIDPANGDFVVKNLPFVVSDNHNKDAFDASGYLQDEWRANSRFTANVGVRYDRTRAYVDETQLSPRISMSWKADDGLVLHAGFARYFIPPPLENVSPTSIAKFDNTTNAADQDTDNAVRCERSSYLDIGLTKQVAPGLSVGLNGYYKKATNQIDDGQFGAANITSPYNYGAAKIYGAELSTRYSINRFSFYGNIALAQGWAKKIISSEFEFGEDELAYIDSHWVRFDQTQLATASAGVSQALGAMVLHGQVSFGSGMRRGFANTESLGSYYPVDVGVEYHFKLGTTLRGIVRLDASNLFDQVYELNDGTGIGVGAPKYGARRGVFVGCSLEH